MEIKQKIENMEVTVIIEDNSIIIKNKTNGNKVIFPKINKQKLEEFKQIP